jgi:beta-phosphoglucomutase-like phosphatase (HAD superfamily)
LGLAGVIFDLDGLLLDTERLSRRAWLAGAADLGVDVPVAVLDTIIGRRRAEVEHEFLQVMGADFDTAALYERHGVHYRAQLDTITPLALRKSGVDALLDWLDTHAIPRAIATSTLARGAAEKLQLAALTERFPVVVTGEQVPRSKPAPDIYLEAARRLDVAPGMCVVFEDSDVGLEAALAAGMRAVAVPDLKPLPDHLLRRVNARLETLADAALWLERVLAAR